MEGEVECASADEDPRGEVDGHDVERLAALAEGGATQEAAVLPKDVLLSEIGKWMLFVEKKKSYFYRAQTYTGNHI